MGPVKLRQSGVRWFGVHMGRLALVLLALAIGCSEGGSREARDAAMGDAGSGALEAGTSDSGRALDAGRDGGDDGAPDASADGGSMLPPLPEPNTQMVSAMVGPEGGMVMHPTGAQLEVPAGALAENVELTIRGVSAPSDAELGTTALGQAFVLGPDGQEFLRPISLRVPFDAARLPEGTAAADAQLWIAPDGSSEFAAMETSVDLEAGVLTARTAHFSIVLPVAPASTNPLRITTRSLADAVRAQAYGPVTLGVEGGTKPYVWSVVRGALPEGLTLTSDGLLSGRAQTLGSSTFTVRVSDGGGRRLEKAFTLNVVALPENATPMLSSIEPTTIEEDAEDTQLTVLGSAFVAGSLVVLGGEGGQALATTFVSAGELAATVPAALLANPGELEVFVFNPAPGGGYSVESRTLTITARMFEDAGVDGGTSDGGTPDGGTLDSGSEPLDGGGNSEDAGSDDAGTGEEPELLVSDYELQVVAVDESYVYFRQNGGLRRLPLAGGSWEQMAGFDGVYSAPRLVDGYFYYDNGVDTLLRQPKAGGTAESLTTTTSFTLSSWDVVGSTAYVRYSNKIDTVPVTGGTRTPLYTIAGSVGLIDVDATSIMYSYYANSKQNLWVAKADGSGSSEVLAGVYVPSGVLDGGLFYYPTAAGIYRLDPSVGASSAEQVAAGGSASALYIAGDDLFYIEGSELKRVLKTGGTPVPLASAGNGSVVADATHVYFASMYPQAGLFRVPR